MDKNEGKIDMDALDAITDRVLSFRPPKSKARKQPADRVPSSADKGQKRRRKRASSKKKGQELDNEDS
ncbi:MAG: hypothetical protein OXF76_10220 [Caldilineaceae bacterium]|nr:hypothetical protein [Caldilineaceae bacterium]